MTDTLPTFGNQVRFYRTRAGLTQEELAEAAGMSVNAIGAQERGTRQRPRQSTVELISNALKLDVPERALLDSLRRRQMQVLAEAGELEPSGVEIEESASPELHPTNLPSYTTPLIGREREIADVRDRLLRPNVRLLTITGPGGIGKTRLAVQVARDLLEYFENGVYFVSLSSVGDPTLVARTIAQTLGIIEAPDHAVIESLKAYLGSRALLLVLDNFEQVVSAAPDVAELLIACPWVKVLATSREVLRLQAEHEYPIPPLRLPDGTDRSTLQHLTQFDAVALFIQRAQTVKPNFAVTNDNAPAIAEICYLVDGLPLAIELVASRLRVLSVRELLQWLRSGLYRHVHGPRDLPNRQQTLWNTMSWSYDLLSLENQSLFRRLAVFVRGFTLAAGEAVANTWGDLDVDFLGGIESLLEKNLLIREESGEGDSRFRMLTVIRQFGLDRLSHSGEAEIIARQHATYFLQLAEQAEPYLRGREADMWLNRLEQEHDNLREALRYFNARQDVSGGLRLAGALQWYWWERGHHREGRDWYAKLLSMPGADERTTERAKALGAAGYLASGRGDNLEAISTLDESLAIYRELNEHRGVAWSLAYLAIACVRRGELVQSETAARESLAIFRDLGDPAGIATALCHLGMAISQLADPEGIPTLEEALTLARQLGDRDDAARALGGLGIAMLRQHHDVSTARRHFAEMLRVAMNLRQPFHIAYSMEWLAEAAFLDGDLERAIRLAEVGAAIRETSGTTAAAIFRPTFAGLIEQARASLAPDVVATLRNEGKAMSLDAAVTYALQGSE